MDREHVQPAYAMLRDESVRTPDSLDSLHRRLPPPAGENLPKGADRYLRFPPDLLPRESSKSSSRENPNARPFSERKHLLTLRSRKAKGPSTPTRNAWPQPGKVRNTRLVQEVGRIVAVSPVLHDLATGDMEHVDGLILHPLADRSESLELSQVDAPHSDAAATRTSSAITSSTVTLRSGKRSLASTKVSLKVSMSLAGGSSGSSSLSGASSSTISLARLKSPVETIS